jgi:hypothetical protein
MFSIGVCVSMVFVARFRLFYVVRFCSAAMRNVDDRLEVRVQNLRNGSDVLASVKPIGNTEAFEEPVSPIASVPDVRDISHPTSRSYRRPRRG